MRGGIVGKGVVKSKYWGGGIGASGLDDSTKRRRKKGFRGSYQGGFGNEGGGVSMRRWGPINGKIYFTGFEENVNVS